MVKKGTPISVNCKIFVEYIVPDGYLTRDRACHALWYYAILTRHNYEIKLQDGVYEDDPEIVINSRQLWKSIAQLYAVDPDSMYQHWLAVDLQWRQLKLPQFPQHLRFDGVHEVKKDAPKSSILKH